MSENDSLTANIRKQLDRIPVDGETRQALDLARRRALDEATDSSTLESWFPILKPVAVFASLALLSLGIWLNGQDYREQENTTIAGLDDLELLSSNEPLEFYQDLEFYIWLENQTLDDPDQA